jgi:hypothetical protein
MTRRLFAVLGSVTALSLTAAGAGCGQETAPTEPAAPAAPPPLEAADRPYAEALSAAVEREELPLDEVQRDCFAGRLVGAVGAEGFEEQGVRPADFEADGLDAVPPLTEEQVGVVAGSFRACGIDLYDYLAGSLGAGGDEQAAACFRDTIGEGALARILALSFGGTDMSEQTQQPLVDAFVGCGHLLGPAEP